MIARFVRWLTHADRERRTDTVVHALRERAQMADIERDQIVRHREHGEPHWLEAALTRREEYRQEIERWTP